MFAKSLRNAIMRTNGISKNGVLNNVVACAALRLRHTACFLFFGLQGEQL